MGGSREIGIQGFRHARTHAGRHARRQARAHTWYGAWRCQGRGGISRGILPDVLKMSVPWYAHLSTPDGEHATPDREHLIVGTFENFF